MTRANYAWFSSDGGGAACLIQRKHRGKKMYRMYTRFHPYSLDDHSGVAFGIEGCSSEHPLGLGLYRSASTHARNPKALGIMLVCKKSQRPRDTSKGADE